MGPYLPVIQSAFLHGFLCTNFWLCFLVIGVHYLPWPLAYFLSIHGFVHGYPSLLPVLTLGFSSGYPSPLLHMTSDLYLPYCDYNQLFWTVAAVYLPATILLVPSYPRICLRVNLKVVACDQCAAKSISTIRRSGENQQALRLLLSTLTWDYLLSGALL